MAGKVLRYLFLGEDGITPAAERGGRSIERLGERHGRVMKTMAATSAALGIAVVGALAYSSKQAMEFQTNMEKIHTQAGGTQQDVKTLGAAVLNLGTTTQQGPNQLAEALFHLKSVGLDNANAMKALKTASDLAAVGGSNLEDTTNALAGAWRTGIKGADSFSQSASTVNAIIGAGNMRMQDLVSAIGTGILPAAKTFGLSFQSVGAALATLTDEGVPAVDAATRLRMSFSLLAAPTKKATGELQDIGLRGNSLAIAMRGPGGIVSAIRLLKTHLDASGLSAVEQAQLLSRAFGGGRSSATIMSLVNNLDVLDKKQKQINMTTGKYGEAVRAQRQTAEAQLKILHSQLEVAAVRLGTAFLPVITKALGEFMKLTAPIMRNAGLMKTLVVVLGALAIAFGIAATAAFVMENVLTLGIVAAIIAVIAIVVLLVKHWHQIWAEIKSITSDAWRHISGVLDVFTHAWGAAFGAARGIVEGAFHFIQGITASFSAWWKTHGDELAEIWRVVMRIIKFAFMTVWGPIVAQAKFAFMVLSTAFRVWLAVVTGIIKIGFAILSAIFKNVVAYFMMVWRIGWASIVNIFKVLSAILRAYFKFTWDTIVAIFSVILDLLTGHWSRAWHDILNYGRQVWNIIKSTASTVWHAMASEARTVFTGMLGFFRSFWSNMRGGFSGLVGAVKGIWSGIEGAVAVPVRWVVSHIYDPFARTIDAVTNFLHMGRPMPILSMSSGGRLPGFGGGDVIPALLEPGETVVSKSTSIALAPVFSAAGVPGYQGGGIIGGIGHVLGGIGSAIGGGIGGLLKSLVMGALETAVKPVLQGIVLGLSHMPGLGSGWGQTIAAIPKVLLQKFIDWLGNQDKHFSSSMGHFPGSFGQWVAKAIGLTGVPAWWANGLGIIAKYESGFNPNAINNWDSNAQHGDPSRGIMQTIGGTFSAYHQAGTSWNIFDPVANIAAAINYIKSRYGSVLNVPGVFSVEHGGGYVGYGNGGIINEPIFGIGRSGTRYRFGEHGRERVTPGTGGDVYIFNISEMSDPDATARRIHQVLRDYKRHKGNQPLGIG